MERILSRCIKLLKFNVYGFVRLNLSTLNKNVCLCGGSLTALSKDVAHLFGILRRYAKLNCRVGNCDNLYCNLTWLFIASNWLILRGHVIITSHSSKHRHHSNQHL